MERAQALLQRGDFHGVSRLCERILLTNVRHVDARYLLGLSYAMLGRPEDAVRELQKVLGIQPRHAAALANLGVAFTQLGRHEEAITTFRRAIACDPSQAGFHHALGNAALAMGDLESAHVAYRTALELDPALAEAANGLGVALRKQGSLAEAIERFKCALRLRPSLTEARANLADAYNDLGVEQLQARRFEEAIESLQHALAQDPRCAEAEVNLGEALRQLGRAAEAIAAFRRAVAIDSRLAPAAYGLGRALLDSGNAEGARSILQRAVELDPHLFDARLLLAVAQEQGGDAAAAIATLQSAVALRPGSVAGCFALSTALHRAGRLDAAISGYTQVLAIDPSHAEAHRHQGSALESKGRLSEAALSFENALRVRGDDAAAVAGLVSCGTRMCDWPMVSEGLQRLRGLPDGIEALHPFVLLAVSDDPQEHLRSSRTIARAAAEKSLRLPPCVPYAHDKIRLAYVSPDFREHPVACLLAALIEQHDRSRFETIALSLNAPDDSPLGQRIQVAFDSFIDVSRVADADVAKLMRDLEVDIAIDLAGFTSGNRNAIFASRPAPVQVNYLGFAGTLGASYIDYILADSQLVRSGEEGHYEEKIVWLPDTYQVNDSHYAVTERTPGRGELGIPEAAFVFCCFNNSFKISERTFAIWMRLLRQVDGSVLWLAGGKAEVERNLRAEALRRGVDSQRLVFAPRVARREDHLARYRQADLFLDTLPFNAHATATDALWCGVPVLTCTGATFAGRVAASVLQAIGLHELICSTPEDYEAFALRLATEPGTLAALRERLATNRSSHALFDTDRWRRHVEAAYVTMWERVCAGLPPASFAIPAIS
jgi:predicted O-linked N-acetylglucosamine transferase (SPINDLY family)